MIAPPQDVDGGAPGDDGRTVPRYEPDDTPAAWAAGPTEPRFRPGQVIFGRYVVQKKLGAGGMGDVWLVTHRELNADRALKVIASRFSLNNEARARFRREARVMAAFHHPNAVTVHDAQLTEQEVAYIDMEYVRGRALTAVLRPGELMPLDWVARVLEQLCDVLQVAHQKGIVHRDLKPANLMLLDGREPGREFLKVLDFGLAKILGGADGGGPPASIDSGGFLGTPAYASPEQAEGAADTRSDIYSTGVILYEFLTGYRPFLGPATRMLVDHARTAPPPFSAANPSVSYPPGVEDLVMRCLAKNPDDRPQTAREVVELFRVAVRRREEPPPAPPTTEPEPPCADLPEKPRRRIPWRLACAVLLVVAGLGLGAWWFLGGRPGGSPGPELLRARWEVSPDGARATLRLSRGARSAALIFVRLPRASGGEPAGSVPYTLEFPKQPGDDGPHRFRRLIVPSYLARTEVTRAEYAIIAGDAAPARADGGLPMTDVDWDHAVRACRDLKAALGDAVDDVRLPWEHEWEYAATLGGRRDAEGEGKEPRPRPAAPPGLPRSVGIEGDDAWGFCDLLDNASEWAGDGFEPDLEKLGLLAADRPLERSDSGQRVVRGGLPPEPLDGPALDGRAGANADQADPMRGFRILVVPRS